MGAIDVNGVACRTPGGVELLHEVSFGVGDGEHVSLVGANGVGKTTLFRVIAGDRVPDDGDLHVDGRLRVMRQLVGWPFAGTVIVVSHDRWFLRGFDRFLVFGPDAKVTEHLEPVFA